MSGLKLEFEKLKRKRVWLIAFVCASISMIWIGAVCLRDGFGSANGSMNAMHGISIINAMTLTVLATVVCSRVCDVDHEARSWNQILCHQRASEVYLAKFACTAIVLFAAAVLETLFVFALSHALAFPDTPGAAAFASLFVSQFAPALGVAAIIEFIALKWENQFVTLSVGLLLALAGLFGLYMPSPFPLLFPSGYFGMLSTVVMDWDAAARVVSYHVIPYPWTYLGILVGMSAATVAGATAWFARKEL